MAAHRHFLAACEKGDLAAVRTLLALKGDRRIDVNAYNEWAFRVACGGGQLPVVRELLGLEGDRHVDVHAAGELALQWTHDNERVTAAMGPQAPEKHRYTCVLQELLALPGTRAPTTGVIKELGLDKLRLDVKWAGVEDPPAHGKYGRGRRAMVCSRVARRVAMRAARAAKSVVKNPTAQ